MISDVLIVTIFAFSLILYSLFLKLECAGIVFLTLFLLVTNVVLDLVTTPIFTGVIRHFRNSSLVPLIFPGEETASAVLILSSALAMICGLIIAWWFWDHVQPTNRYASDIDYSQNTLNYAWKISTAIFLFGAICHAVVIYYLMREFSIFEFAQERAVVTSNEALRWPTYYYARVLSRMTAIGSWGMLLFSRNRKLKFKIAIVAIIIVFFSEVLYGGRARSLTFFLTTLIVYHYGIKPIKLHQVIIVLPIVLIGVSYIYMSRFSNVASPEVLFDFTGNVLIRRSIHDAAFALRWFPEEISFIGLGGIIGKLSHLFPTISEYIPGTTNIWNVMVDYFYGGRNPTRGIGGQHWVPAAEHYMLFGFSGVITIGLSMGLFYGRIFTWQRRNSNNMFLLIFASYAFMILVRTVMDGKMIGGIGAMGFSALLPVGILAALTYDYRFSAASLLVPLYICALSFVARRFFNSEVFDYTFAISLIPAYIMSLKFIAKARPDNNIRLEGTNRAAFGKENRINKY